ncbi:hypothetical protein GL218_08554 [Daldinia childiae]|uniref:uncharacterized protein n=1 Tax=Daldinia childiae TaxID=326645 RepID=UPI001445D587|nr:uncharacterized protein GL218_08554 [Daldinia childiae]KAF3067361.1 hypothetical protein GL218_08554 [Daldinia childiae]
MSKNRTRIPMGSLNDMASTVRDKKNASKTKPLGSTQLQKIQKLAKDTSSDDDSGTSSSDDSSGSGSDSENDLEAAKSKYAAKQATKRKVTEPKANVTKSGPTKTIPNAGASSSKASTKAAASAGPNESNSDSDSDSESSDSSDGGPTKNGAAVKGGNKDEKEAESSSDSESDDEKPSAQKAVEAESSSDEASDSSSDDESEEAHGMEIDNDQAAISRVNGNDASEVSRPGWLNSSEFTIRKASSDNPAKDVAEFFNKTNLEGKQVWYFTAPASLPITVLRDIEIDLSKATPGETLLNHKGDDYGLDLESHATSTQIQLLIPSKGGDNYTSLNRGIDSTVHLRRIAKFGPGGTVSATATEDYAPVPKAIREQPQGLRPRFTPIGVPSSTPQVQSLESRPAPVVTRAVSSSESDSESESTSDKDSAVLPTATNSKKSKKPEVVNGKLKRKQPEGEGKSAPVQEPRSQEKSAKRPKTTKPTSSKVPSSSKETPILPQTPNGSSSNKKAKQDKSKYSIQSTKQTPVPVPKVFSMNR